MFKVLPLLPPSPNSLLNFSLSSRCIFYPYHSTESTLVKVNNSIHTANYSHSLTLLIRSISYMCAILFFFFFFELRTSHSSFTVSFLFQFLRGISLRVPIIIMSSVQDQSFPSPFFFSILVLSLTFFFIPCPSLLYTLSPLVILILSHDFRYPWYIMTLKIMPLAQTFLLNSSFMCLNYSASTPGCTDVSN